MSEGEDKPPLRMSTPPGHTPDSPKVMTLTPEEVKTYKDCMNGMVYKAGLPFATVLHFISSWTERAKQEAAQQPQIKLTFSLRKTFFFIGNVLLGTFLFSPICYQKLHEMSMDSQRRKRAEIQPFSTPEPVQPTTLLDDYNYPTDLTSSLNEAESTFTSEFTPSKILEEEPVRSPPRTTYQDLRRQHRSVFDRTTTEPPPSQIPNVPDERPIVSTPPTAEREPKKFVKRNKYGDEIE